MNTSGSSLNSANRNSVNRRKKINYWYSWVVKIRNTSEAVHNTPILLGHHTNRGPMGLGLYDRGVLWPS